MTDFKFGEYTKMAGVAGIAIAAISAFVEAFCQVIYFLAEGKFGVIRFLDGMRFGVTIAFVSLAILAVIALMALAACFLAEVCSRRSPAMEAFFENIAKALISQLKD